jgi:hypothetical protein
LRRFQPNSRVACVEASPPKRSACVRIGSFSIEGSRAGIHLTLAILDSFAPKGTDPVSACDARARNRNVRSGSKCPKRLLPADKSNHERMGRIVPTGEFASRLVPLVTEHHTLFLPPSGSRDRPRSIVDVVNCCAMQLVKPTDCSREPVHQGHGGIRCVPRVWRNVGPSRMHAADSTWLPLLARKSRIIGDVISLTAIALLAGSDAHGSPSTRLSRYQHTKHR